MNIQVGKLLGFAAMVFSLQACAQTAGQNPQMPVASWNKYEVFDESRGSPAQRGQAIYNNWCTACHSRDLRDAPGTTSLQFKYGGSVPAVLEDRTDLTPEQVNMAVRKGIAMMPFFRPTELDDEDLKNLVAYLVKK